MASRGSSKGGAHALPPSASKPKQHKKRTRRDVVSIVLAIVGIILLGAAGTMFYRIWSEYHVADNEYQALASVGSPSDDGVTMQVDWDALEAVNPDIVAWVRIPDTEIDYPVAQADDNNYYLYYTFEKEENSSGCIFLDAENSRDFSDRNSIIYGHHMLNGSMFAQLAKYVDQDWYDAHQYILLATPSSGTKRLKVVSVFLANGDELLRRTAFNDSDDFHSYVQGFFDRNVVSINQPDVNDIGRIYTFATCSYQFNDARTIVVAVEVDSNGTLVQDTLDPQTTTQSEATS